jgi:hypothetical protein
VKDFIDSNSNIWRIVTMDEKEGSKHEKRQEKNILNEYLRNRKLYVVNKHPKQCGFSLFLRTAFGL